MSNGKPGADRGAGATARGRLSEPVVWGVLLVVALGLAYQTWTRDPEAMARNPSATIWDGTPDRITSIHYSAIDGNETTVERRTAPDGSSYLWATAIRQNVVPDEFTPTPTGIADTAHFMVGPMGDRLLELLAAPFSPREIGQVAEDSYERYGLDEPLARVRVRIGDATHEIEVGGEVYGEGNRYVREPSSGRIYVLSSEALVLLADAEYHLLDRRIHSFDASQVAWVTVHAGDRQRTMYRSDGALPGESIWSSAASPDQPDQTFANFMERAGRLWAVEYYPDLDISGSDPVLRIEYYAADSTMIGFVDMVRWTRDDGSTGYLFQTEHTRVPIRSSETLTADVLQDLEVIF